MFDNRMIRRFLKALGACALVSTTSLAVSPPALAGCNSNDYTASICSTAASFCPKNFLPAAGQVLQIADYTELYALLGCNFGGDCRSSFGLPDLRGRAAVGAGQGPGLSAINIGQKVGAEGVELSVDQLAAHSHTALFSPSESGASVLAFDGMGMSPTPSAEHNHLQTVAANPFSPATDASLYGTGDGNPVPLQGVSANFGGTVTVLATGAGAAIPTESPVIAVTYCISNTGLFPPRN